MLHEPASSLDDYPQLAARPLVEDSAVQKEVLGEVRAAVETVLEVRDERLYQKELRPHILSVFFFSKGSRVIATYKGHLRQDAEAAYDELDAMLVPHDLLPVFRANDDSDKATVPHIVHVVMGRVRPVRGGSTLSAVLLILTILSVLFVGTIQAISQISRDDPARADAMMAHFEREMWRGLPYAFSIMLILGTHEMGHYLMTRRHKLAASLPYFFPFPFGLFGTFGAAIRLREPIRNRKMLLDVGAAGPLAGMVFALPIVLIGLATSPVDTIDPDGLVEGNSILYALSKIVVFGRFLPDGSQDVYINQLAMAGWTGLLITGLNLIPVGQLDGGHVIYSLLGRHARKLYFPIIGALMVLALQIANELIVFVVLIMFLGNYHAVPLDDLTPLDKKRRGVALLVLVVFVLVFVPMPFSEAAVRGAGSNLPLRTPGGDRILLPVILGTLWLARRRLPAPG